MTTNLNQKNKEYSLEVTLLLYLCVSESAPVLSSSFQVCEVEAWQS